ncbi:hypothetical protein BDB00DRAFT_840550 [Zychaea mexicana]|uniref:uncharacterized protein n=1 Tax=Zychaea mexicana TaxID=64656 RepID=UPI0022FED6D9|nr:uncharacterized protein BDB00DRAFT_840550 [Zychaea mexicana]KAI9489897.1 hypothetical protein BDB00DRAFT_840550 [Zychaea mexicana]
MKWTSLSFLLFLLSLLVLLPAGTMALIYGEQCDATPLYSATWQYDDSCRNVYLYCNPATNTCDYKGCSNSDYIKGWDARVHAFPKRCQSGSYCPDDSSKCTPLVTPGGHCELQRDDECAGQVPICLNSTCYVKAIPLGGNCVEDTTDYVSYDAQGYALRQRIVRDNCIQGTFCSENNRCSASSLNGAACSQDRECISETCSVDGVCVNGPDVFRTIATWLWAVLGLAVILFILLILGILWVLHRYQSKKERAKIIKFFGDNEEFAKYAMLEEDDGEGSNHHHHHHSIHNNNDSSSNNVSATSTAKDSSNRTSMVFLAHPDYHVSSALGTTRPLSLLPGSNNSVSRLRNSTPPPPRMSTGSLTPPMSCGSRSSMPRASTSDFNQPIPTGAPPPPLDSNSSSNN